MEELDPLSQGVYYKQRLSDVDRTLPRNFTFVEVGTAEGDTARYAIDALNANRSNRWFFTVDPYGSKPYNVAGSLHSTFDYNDAKYMRAIPELYNRAKDKLVNYFHWKLTSTDFAKIFGQIIFWEAGNKLKEEFGFAYLDGDHDWETVLQEVAYFYPRMPSGAVICIDDYNLFSNEDDVRNRLSKYPGTWFFNTSDDHYRCYLTKA